MEERRSPVPYRENPMAYEPAKFCICGKKAPRWLSWSPGNPGRKYYACVDAMLPEVVQIGGCGYFEWHDKPMTPFIRTLLLDLRDAAWRNRASDGTEAFREKNAEIDALRKLVLEKDITIDAMSKKLEEKSFCITLMYAMAIFVVGFVCTCVMH